MGETPQSDGDRRATEARQLSQKTTLSDREAEVYLLKKEGFTHAEIADILGVKKGTVDSHAYRVRMKYGLAYHTVQELKDDYDSGDQEP